MDDVHLTDREMRDLLEVYTEVHYDFETEIQPNWITDKSIITLSENASMERTIRCVENDDGSITIKQIIGRMVING